MGNVIELPNITPEVMETLALNEPTKSEKKTASSFDEKNYLNVRLSEGQTSKTLTIRLLPMDLTTGNPFAKVHFHTVKVPLEISKASSLDKSYKSYICLMKNDDIDHEKFGHKCPFCEIRKIAYEKSEQVSDPVERKSWQKVSCDNIPREAVIVRCIERGKENEGVKFWKFNLRMDQTDPYNQIMSLYNQRKAEGAAQGHSINILDLNNGYDLVVKITEGNSAPVISDAKFPSPLSTDVELMKSWIYDTKKWQEVFTPKDYDYLSIVSQMKVPWFDRNTMKWVEKSEINKDKEEKAAQVDNEIKQAEAALCGQPTIPVTPTVNVVPTQVVNTVVDTVTVVDDDDDLPF